MSTARQIIESLSREEVSVHKPSGPLTKLTTAASRQDEDDLLARIKDAPLRPEFRGKPGITQKFSRYDQAAWGSSDFDHCYDLAKRLEARGLVTVTPLGSATFEVTVK